jgi:hypothetical protein
MVYAHSGQTRHGSAEQNQMTDRNTNTSQHPATPDVHWDFTAEQMEIALTATGSNFERIGIHEVLEHLPADTACGCDGEYRCLRHCCEYHASGGDVTRSCGGDWAFGPAMATGEVARAIAHEMYTAALQREIATPCEPEQVRIHCANALAAKVFPEGHADRASLIAACILDCPIKHFTTTEIAKYARLTLDTPLSEREIDSVLLALKAEKRLTTRGGFWIIAQ